MAKYAMEIYGTPAELEAAVEAVDNDVVIRPIMLETNNQFQYGLIVGGSMTLGFDGGTL